MDHLKIIGKPTPLIDAPIKVSGKAQYVGDLQIPGMLEGKVLRSPYPHARILNLCVEAAERVPGVYAVVTGSDLPDQTWGLTEIKDQYVLARNRVRFVGEEVAAVAAIDEDTAQEALELIDVEYELLEAVFDPESAMSDSAPLIHDKPRNIAYELQVERGDVESALRQAEVVHEAAYVTQLHYQAYMEPMGTVVRPDSRGGFTMWSPLQTIFSSRDLIADLFGLKRQDLRILQPFVGGAFGGKSNEDPNPMITLALAMKTERPVRLMNTRVDEFQASRPQVPMKIWLRMAASKGGKLLSKEVRLIADNGAYTGLASFITKTATYRPENLYKIENIRSAGLLIYTNKIPTGAFRGFGNTQGTFAQESHLDALAHRLGMDPAELRLRNVVRTGDVTVHGWKIGSCGLEQGIKRCIEATDWQNKRMTHYNGNLRRGIGMACTIHVSGNREMRDWEGARAYVDLDAEGRATVRSGEGDIGQGARTLAAIIAAEELQIGLDRVVVAETTTEGTPYTLGAFASRLALIAGQAVRKAAADARDQMGKVAADFLEVSPEDIEWKEGLFVVRGTESRSLSLTEACQVAVSRNGNKAIRGKGEYDPPSEKHHPETFYGNISVAYEFAVQVAEVEVDMETGRVNVLTLTSADDVGRALNPLAVHGQVEGAAIQGFGFGVIEELKVENGQIINGNFGDYILPKAHSVPAIHSIVLETIDPYGPYGAKGASEAAIVPTAAAIANAIFNATGLQFTSLPISSERVITALRNHSRNQ